MLRGPEEKLYLLFQAWMGQTKNYVSALDALASATLQDLPERTRKEHKLQISGVHWPTYAQWYGLALHGHSHVNLLSVDAKGPFAVAWYRFTISRPELLKQHVPSDHVAIRFGKLFSPEVIREVAPYQDKFVVAEVVDGATNVYTGLTAEDAASRTLNDIINGLTPTGGRCRG